MKKSPKLAVAVLAASSLVFVACGDDSDDAATETSAAAVESTEAETDESMAEETGDIVAVAAANADFSTLVAAVEAAGLVETLQGEGPFTVFAPTNAAFEALPAGLVEKLLLPENKDVLVQILTYHVVGAKVLAADVMAGDVDSVEGSPITITTDDGVVLNGSAKVVTTDVMASNGVIHVIDAVILPPGLDVSGL